MSESNSNGNAALAATDLLKHEGSDFATTLNSAGVEHISVTAIPETPEVAEQIHTRNVTATGEPPVVKRGAKRRTRGGIWGIGAASICGHVRAENQDAAWCFETSGKCVLTVADGCGGIPHGRRAAQLAVRAAGSSIIRGAATKRNSAAEVVAAIYAAERRLSIEGEALKLTNGQDGLRTTLIVFVSTETEHHYAYIGDGGGILWRASGVAEEFLMPQKLAGTMNVLSASLGPVMQGEPVSGTLKKESGDLVMIGSDGVFDRVNETFAENIARAAIQAGGDLQRIATQAVQELAALKDEDGYIFDDNLTLALMGDGTPPELAEGTQPSPEVKFEERAESARQVIVEEV